VDHQFFLNALYVLVKHDIKRPKQCISSKVDIIATTSHIILQ